MRLALGSRPQRGWTSLTALPFRLAVTTSTWQYEAAWWLCAAPTWPTGAWGMLGTKLLGPSARRPSENPGTGPLQSHGIPGMHLCGPRAVLVLGGSCQPWQCPWPDRRAGAHRGLSALGLTGGQGLTGVTLSTFLLGFLPLCPTDLQFPRGHLENQFHHTAHSQAGCPCRVHLVPDGVAVHLRKHVLTVRPASPAPGPQGSGTCSYNRPCTVYTPFPCSLLQCDKLSSDVGHL